jgi:hypothetical protein
VNVLGEESSERGRKKRKEKFEQEVMMTHDGNPGSKILRNGGPKKGGALKRQLEKIEIAREFVVL